MELDDNTLYFAEEAAPALRQKHTRNLERWRAKGTGPDYVKIGRRVFYTGRALKSFIARQTRTFTAEQK